MTTADSPAQPLGAISVWLKCNCLRASYFFNVISAVRAARWGKGRRSSPHLIRLLLLILSSVPCPLLCFFSTPASSGFAHLPVSPRLNPVVVSPQAFYRRLTLPLPLSGFSLASSMSGPRGAFWLDGGDFKPGLPRQLPQPPDVLLADQRGEGLQHHAALWAFPDWKGVWYLGNIWW